METSTQVSLSWKEFEQCAGETFRSLLADTELADVTLACADDTLIKAHKLILCASSPFFKNVLSKNPHSHPLVYMKGVDGRTMEALLGFIYRGEAKVLEADIKVFLDTADELRIRGLFDVTRDFPADPATAEAAVVKEEVASYLGAGLGHHASLVERNWGGTEPQAFLEYQAITDYTNQDIARQPAVKCTKCNFETTSLANLKIHMNTFHNPQAKPSQKKETVKCNLCQMVLINERKHLLDHCKVYHNA